MSRKNEIIEVKALGERIGYGNMMDIASALWSMKLSDDGIERIMHVPTVEPCLLLGAVYIPCSGLYYSMFNSDPQFIKVGILSCLVIAALSPIQNRQIIYNGIFRAVGDVKYTLRAAVVSVTLVNTVVSFVGTILLSLGIWGIWAGAFANQTVRMLMLHRRYRQTYRDGETP